MNPRERVKNTLNHQEPDRIPIDLGSTWVTTVNSKVHQKLLQHFNINESDQILSLITQTSIVNEKILKNFDIDFRALRVNKPKKREIVVIEEKDCYWYCDQWQIKRKMPKKNGYYYDICEHPLKKGNIQELKSFRWPSINDLISLEGLKENAQQMFEQTNYALVGDIGGAGIFENAWYLRGFENWLTDLLINESYCRKLMDKIVEIKYDIIEKFLEATGNYIEVVTLGDDFSGQDNPLISIDLFKKLIKPYYKILINFIKNKTDAKIFFHSCGNIKPFLDDFIDLGIDIINPVQISASQMDPYVLKKEYGNKIVFWGGGCDAQKILPFGNEEEVEKEVIHNINILSPGGGYVFGPIHVIQGDVPIRNIIKMFNTARKNGFY
jgi:uroporphyrinogen decarboxylase